MSTVDPRESVDSTGIGETWDDRPSVDTSSRSSQFSQENPMNESGAAAGNTPQPNAVIGADLRNVLGEDIRNVVAIAAEHNFMNRMSGLKNNLDTLALKYYYGIDIQGIKEKSIIDYLNGIGSDTSKPEKVNVINSSTGNVQDNVDYEANAAIFKIIKESIASETETKNWSAGKGKNEHRARVAGASGDLGGLKELNLKLSEALEAAGKAGVKTIPRLKLADVNDPCTQIVFGYTRNQNNKIESATGRIQAFTAGAGSSASFGTFSMELKDGKYVITVGGDSSQTLLAVIGNLLGVNPKDIIVQQLVEKKDTTVVDATSTGADDGNTDASSDVQLGLETADVGGPIIDQGSQDTSTTTIDPPGLRTGGKRKTKRRKHKTVRFKVKKHRKTSKKHVKSHKKSHKKGKKH